MKYCAFADCSREAYKGELCNAHRQQRKRGVPLRPLRDPKGGRFGGDAVGRLKRAAIAYADAELEEHERSWKNLADAALWYARGIPKSGSKSVSEALQGVREAIHSLEVGLTENPPRTPPRARSGT